VKLTNTFITILFSWEAPSIIVTATDKKGSDAVLPIFHCEVVKCATSHNKNEHLLTEQMHINEPLKSHKTVLITCKCLKIKN
jgi:hypothetical protein